MVAWPNSENAAATTLKRRRSSQRLNPEEAKVYPSTTTEGQVADERGRLASKSFRAGQPVGSEPAVVGFDLTHVLDPTNALRAGGGPREGPSRGVGVAGVDAFTRSPGPAVAAA